MRILLLLAWTWLFIIGSARAEATTLEGGVRHMDLMPSVEESFRKGNVLDASVFENLNSGNGWVKIPSWMAGTWLVQEETAVYRKDFASGRSTKSPHRFKARHKFIYGMQKDRLGGIWHYIGVPYKSETRLTSVTEIHLVKEKRFDPYTENRVRFRSVVNVIRVKRTNHGRDQKIKESYVQESITSYEPYSANSDDIKLQASTKSFNQDGKPMIQADNEARVKKLAEFSPVDSYRDRDMRYLFRLFLTETGRDDLLP
ncbi:MAG: hypothetical protein R3D26_02555 [Cyanobacteriota/Melainabacteria group bacterium]